VLDFITELKEPIGLQAAGFLSYKIRSSWKSYFFNLEGNKFMNYYEVPGVRILFSIAFVFPFFVLIKKTKNNKT